MLDKILPLERIRNLFPDIKEHKLRGRKNLHQLDLDQCSKLNGIGLHQWDRLLCDSSLTLDPRSIAPYVDSQKRGVISFIGNQIKRPLVEDIVYQNITVDRNKEDITVAEIMVAHLYPGDLHLADIEFSNPDKPTKYNEQRPHQKFEGLGLLDCTIYALKDAAKELGCRAVTLTAADKGLRDLFINYGFTILDTPAGRMAKELDMGCFPMEVLINNDYLKCSKSNKT